MFLGDTAKPRIHHVRPKQQLARVHSEFIRAFTKAESGKRRQRRQARSIPPLQMEQKRLREEEPHKKLLD